MTAKAQPLPYQIDGARFLSARRYALLADAPRVGKTAQAIVAADFRMAERVLWLTTASARADHARAWREFGRLDRSIEVVVASAGARLDSDVTITTYDLARGALFDRLMKQSFDVLVLDEGHRLANRETRRTEAIYGKNCIEGGLVSRARHVYVLTGTPSPNNYAELWPMLRRLAPNSIEHDGRPMSFTGFRNRYCKVIDNGFGLQIVGNKNGIELRNRIAPFFLRRTLDDVAPDLPKQRIGILPVEAHAHLDELAELTKSRLMVDMAARLDAAVNDEQRDAIMARVDQSLKLRLSRLTGLAKVPGVAEWVNDEQKNGLEKIVLFAWHRDVIAELRQRVGQMTCVVDGSTTAAERDVQKRLFQESNSHNIFIGQIQAAGEAIDLSAADEVLFVESSYVPKDNEQAAARVLNIKKTRPTLARFATMPGSIDERIQAIAKRKMEDIRRIFS